jgi:hypothetical protein
MMSLIKTSGKRSGSRSKNSSKRRKTLKKVNIQRETMFSMRSWPYMLEMRRRKFSLI